MVRCATPRTGEPRALPGVAPVAMQQGRYAARLIPTGSPAARRAAVPLPRQGHARDDRARPRGSRHPRAASQRLPGLDHLAGRAPLLPDRLREPRARVAALGLQLLHPRPRRAPDHRGCRELVIAVAQRVAQRCVSASAACSETPLSPKRRIPSALATGGELSSARAPKGGPSGVGLRRPGARGARAYK